MKKLLFATDFSQASENALAYAAGLSRDLDADLHLLHVFHLSPANTSHFTAPHETRQLLDRRQKEVVARLNRSALMAGVHSGAHAFHAVNGQLAAHCIRTFAEKNQYDLIIVAGKGEGGAKEAFFGSVTTGLLTESPRPLLIIPEHAGYRGIKAIAYATNFAPSDDEMVMQIAELSRRLGGAATHYLHVSEQRIGEQERTGYRKILMQKDVAPFERFSWIEHQTIQQGIDSYVKKEQIDLLTLFIPERTLWERLFHRSVSRRVYFDTAIPLLVYFG